jgi:hypothetical protein
LKTIYRVPTNKSLANLKKKIFAIKLSLQTNNKNSPAVWDQFLAFKGS